MTCKDCIHENVCNALIKSGCPYLDEEVPADAFCMEFRNTADVVPKSEVEKIIEEAFKMMQDNFVNTPIYKVFPSYLKAELIKKYTEA